MGVTRFQLNYETLITRQASRRRLPDPTTPLVFLYMLAVFTILCFITLFLARLLY